jgi:hypothetical protein
VKSQAAIEFLTTYGWALFMFLFVIGAFSYVIIDSNSVTHTCVFDNTFFCSEVNISLTGSGFVLKNVLGKSVYISDFNVTGCTPSAITVSNGSAQTDVLASFSPILFKPNQELIYSVSCSLEQNPELSIKIMYNLKDSVFEKVSLGRIFGTI